MGDEATSSTNDVTREGLSSRTQSYNSIASSNSRSSYFPDYDFREEDRPGNYSGGKKKDKKTEKPKKDDKKSKGDKKSKKDEKLDNKEKQKPKKKVEEKNTKNKKEPKPKKEKNSKDKKDKKNTKTSTKKDDFQEELVSTVGKNKTDTSMTDVSNFDDVSIMSEGGTSRDSSISRKSSKKNKKEKKTKKRGRSKNKKNKNKKSKSRSLSRGSSQASLSGLSTDDDTDIDDVTGDGKSKKSKTKKGLFQRRTKKNYKVVDVDEEIGVKPKREPFVYNCCFCCSLGAGSLMAGIIFVAICIAYLVVRVEEFKVRAVLGIWSEDKLLANVWRLLLIIGFMTASLCMLASFILIIASCLCGSKEKYNRLRKCVMFWFVTTLAAFINNVGEAVFVQTVPNVTYGFHSADKISEIKANNTKLWALTGIFTFLFIYITLILLSYLRLLKYMDSPKIGTAPTPSSTTPKAEIKPVVIGKPRKNPVSNTGNDRIRTVSETSRESRSIYPELPLRSERKEKRSNNNKNFEDRIYENTSFVRDNEEAGPSAPISRTSSVGSIYSTYSETKRETFQDVLKDIADDPNVFDNMSKPKPLKRSPIRRLPAAPKTEGIYVNHEPQPVTSKPPYTQVSKPLKRAASLSDVSSPMYDDPPADIDFKELLDKKKEMDGKNCESGDTGFGSRSSIASSFGSRPDITEMEKLAERLRQEREALDKSGNCDPAMADNLTQMALNALKLSEKVLQNAKSENSRPASKAESEEKPPVKQNLKLATSFFDELSRDPNAMTANPIEEMFRMYGKDLCSQNPEMVNRYLSSYKSLQEHKSRRHNFSADTGISEAVVNEQKPWMAIMNPSEAVPAIAPMQHMAPFAPTPVNPLLSSMSQSSVGGPHPYPTDYPQFNQGPFVNPPPVSQAFHTVSHAQSGPPPPNTFFPIEYPLQNSASYNPEPPAMNGPQNSAFMNKHPPNFDPSRYKYPPQGSQKTAMGPHIHDDIYYEEECPYSCCYSYDDYGSVYGEYGAYPSSYAGSDCIYGDMYTGSNWFPMGDPAYSLDPYYNPYEYWDEPAPPYTENSSTVTSHRPRPGSRGYDSKAASSRRSRDGTTSRGYTESSRGSKGYSGRSSKQGYSYKSRSLPNLLDEDLYSDNNDLWNGRRSSRSSHNLAEWGIENDDLKDVIGRPMSRESKSKSLPRTNSFSTKSGGDTTTSYAYLKGYKTALREALLSLNDEKKSSTKSSGNKPQEEFIDNLISQASGRNSKSMNRTISRESNFSRTMSSDSRISNAFRSLDREKKNKRKFSTNPVEKELETRSMQKSRSSNTMSRATSRDSDFTGKMPKSISRRTSKLSFRPASRPGQIMSDEYYEDYRSTSSIPPVKNDDEFGFTSRKSSRTSVGFKSLQSGTSRNTDEDILEAFDMMSSHGGRPSTRSRMSSRNSMRSKDQRQRMSSNNESSTYPYSKDDHFYNTLNHEQAFADRPVSQQGQQQSRSASRNDEEMSQNVSRKNSISRRQFSRDDGDKKPVQWFIGNNDKEPIYSSEYEHQDLRVGDSFTSVNKRNPIQRSASYPEQSRLDSIGSSKRKVTFDKKPRIKEVTNRRPSWN